MSVVETEQEAVMWCNEKIAKPTRFRKVLEWDEHGQLVRARNPDTGQSLVERVPQGAFYGTPLTGVQPANFRSYVPMLKHDGHIVNMRVTNAAAHDPNGPDQSAARYMNAKARALGWVPVGSCPATMLLNGDIGPGQLKAEGSKDGKPCNAAEVGPSRPPCRHFKAELAARRDLQAKKMAAYEKAVKTADEKAIEAQTEIQQKNADALLEAVKHMVGAVGEQQKQIAALSKERGK